MRDVDEQVLSVYENVLNDAICSGDMVEDRRGRTKQEEELTNEEKLERRIQQIERENERLRAENLFLKKLEEIERRG